jgi:hypothetical protein
MTGRNEEKMKKIISGAKYDTETAKVIGSWSNTADQRDFNYMEETLYRAKFGKYFLYGMGGALTRYAVNDGEGHSLLGEKIIPMSRKNAQKWAEEHLDTDEYEAVFGEVPETGDESEAMNLKVSPQLKSKLWKLAEERKTTLSATVEELLTGALEATK